MQTRMAKKSAYLFLVALWMAFEKFHLDWEFSWPWLNLGNAFANTTQWIQWYEFTGSFGGTLWVLIVNIIALGGVQHYLKTRKIKSSIRKAIPVLFWIAIPIAISLLIYTQRPLSEEKVLVTVLQPNIDPYQKKFTNTNVQLLEKITEVAKAELKQNPEFLLTPEGYLDEGFGLDLLAYKTTPIREVIGSFNTTYPETTLLTGAQSYRIYAQAKKAPTRTANQTQNGVWYDIYNSAFQFENNIEDQYYHKSKLVVGVEYMPYKHLLKPIMGEFLLDFGGTIATRGIQKKRSVFTSSKGISTAPIICYESIYGSYVTEYVRNGAQFLSIITNDAWWGNTQGHQQLLSYARLRAIENRRAVARSANTGISAFINSRGEIEKSLAYEAQGALIHSIELNKKLTFYTVYGDYLARWSFLIFGLLFLIALSGRNKSQAAF